jgi:hypothetical protein
LQTATELLPSVGRAFRFKRQPNCSRPSAARFEKRSQNSEPTRRQRAHFLRNQHPRALPPLEEPSCCTCSTALLLLTTTMSPPHYMMCKELMRAAAEKAAAASILIELSTVSTASGPGTVATTAAESAMSTSQAKTMPDSIAKDTHASCGNMRALCAAASLVRSTLRLLSLRAFRNSEAEAHGGRRQEDDTLVVGRRVVPQPASVGVTPQPEAVVAPAAVAVRDDDDDAAAPVGDENMPDPASDNPACYAYRHSWRRRNIPVVVAAGGEEAAPVVVASIPEPAGDVPACYAFRHSWQRRRKASVVVAAGDEDAAPVKSEASVVRSTERRAVRVRIWVAGAVVGICLAAPVVVENSTEVGSCSCSSATSPIADAPDTATLGTPNALGTSQRHVAGAAPPEAPELAAGHEHEHSSPQVLRDEILPRLVEAVRGGWRGRPQRPNRGRRYAAALAALLPAPRRRRA